MTKHRSVSCIGLGGLVVSLIVAAGHADPIPIGNASFEDSGLASGNWTNTIPVWNEDNEDSNGSFAESIDNFNAGDGGSMHLGINSMATSINNGVIPPDTIIYTVWQDLGIPVEPNTLYTLTVAVGNRNTSFTLPGNQSIFELAAGDSTLAFGEFDASTIPASTFVDLSIDFTSDDNPPAGDLVIKLSNVDTEEHGSRSHYDNVRLDAVSVAVGPVCDFTGNGLCELEDLDELMYTGLGTNDPKYDLDGNGVVDLADRDEWLSTAGAETIGVPYVTGDTDLDGLVVAGDLNNLGTNWTRQDATSWQQGDFDGDGAVVAGDLNEMGKNWQHGVVAAAQAAAVPEPSSLLLLVVGLIAAAGLRRR